MKHIGKFVATLGAAVSLLVAGCSVTTNPDILYAINPPAHQLQLAFNGNTYADGAAVTMTKTLKSAGDKEAFTLKNISSASGMTVNTVTVDDATHFAVSGFTADTAIDATSSSVFYVAFNNAPAATETLATTLRIAYRIDGHSRTQTFTLRATREVNTAAAMISITDDSGTAIANNDANAYDFGYSDTLTTIEKTFVITNSGTLPLTITSIISDNTAAFGIPTNPQGTPIAPGATGKLTVQRTSASTAASATIAIISNASNYAQFNLNVKSQNKPNGDLSILDYNGTAVPTTGYLDLGLAASRTFTITNTGAGPLTLYSVTSSNSGVLSITDGPASGAAVATGASTTFKIAQSSTANATSATITVTGNSGSSTFTRSFNVVAGGTTINATVGGTFAYKLSSIGYDFGGLASTKQITLSNTGSANITLASSAVSGASVFADGTTYPMIIPAQSSGTITLTFNPTSDTSDYVADYVLTDTFGRTFTFAITGSGYQQPTNITDTPALWLRADRINAGNTLIDGTKTKVTIWPDSSGNNMNAIANLENGPTYYRPTYNESGIGTKPSLSWSGTECMEVLGTIINNTTGSTTFVVFKPTVASTSVKYILLPYNGSTLGYPQLSAWNPWYFDTSDGFYADANQTNRKLYSRFAVTGYGTTGPNPTGYGYPKFPDYSRDNNTIAGKTYVMGLWFDSIVAGLKQNIGCSINGTDLDLVYLHSHNTTSYTGTQAAYGLRIDNDKGAKRADPSPAANDYCNTSGVNYQNRINPHTSPAINPNSRITSLYIGALINATTPTPVAASTFIGEIAEILIYPKPLTSEQMAIINNYLCKKYGATDPWVKGSTP
jgi:hypothetical protein